MTNDQIIEFVNLLDRLPDPDRRDVLLFVFGFLRSTVPESVFSDAVREARECVLNDPADSAGSAPPPLSLSRVI